MRRVRQMVLMTATLAGCGAVGPMEGVFEQRPKWVDAERLAEEGVYGRGQAYAVSDPHMRVSTADEQARSIVARTAKTSVQARLLTMGIEDAVRDEAQDALQCWSFNELHCLHTTSLALHMPGVRMVGESDKEHPSERH